jgi:hypothetical protein
MKESTLSAKMARRVRDRGGWCRKVAGGPYGAGWPDLVGVYKGLFLGIEVKLPTTRNTVTDLQAATMAEMRAAGALALMLSSVRQLDHLLDCIDVASTWPVTDFGPYVVLKRIGREAQERLQHGYAPGISTLEQRFWRSKR